MSGVLIPFSIPVYPGVSDFSFRCSSRADADGTLDRIARARTDADTPDDAAAEQAWRQIATLASRLHRQARNIVIAHEDNR